MAYYSHLPIYNKAFALLKEFNQRVPGFSKQYKYFLGGDLIRNNIEVIRLIIKANGERDREKRQVQMEALCTTIEILITNLRIANELRQLGGQRQYLFLAALAVEISKQAEGWKKYAPE